MKLPESESKIVKLLSPSGYLGAAIVLISAATPVIASDWDEDTKPETPRAVKQIREPEAKSSNSEQSGETQTEQPKDTTFSTAPLKGKVEKAGSTRDHERLQGLIPQTDSSGPLTGKALDDELRGMVRDGGLKPLAPILGDAPLKGSASLQGGKGQLLDPDEEDPELMVEWDRWRNRFLRAVQLGIQDILNNPEPEDYEAPRVDPRTGVFTSRYPLGTGAAFSCLVTAEGQIKNLEIIEFSGFPKYDRALLRSVQQLAGTRILVFPKGSHRRTVVQPGRIKTATSNDFQYHHFGDVERTRGRGR